MTPEPNLLLKEKLKIFAMVHWRGLVCLFGPILCMVVLLPLPPQKYQWPLYCFLLMVVFWVTECIPLPVTSFLPFVLFPLNGVLSSFDVCEDIINDPMLVVLGGYMLAAAMEQSGLHKRMAFIAIQSVGYSHEKLLGAMVVVTTFVSMGIHNTVATTMMIPFIFAILKVFEDQKLLKIYDVTESGEKIASDITTCYFCTATYSATIGGIGTLIGTPTTLDWRESFMDEYPNAPEYLTFPMFSAFGIPYMILLDIFMILYILVVYVGFLRPNSPAAKRAKIPHEVLVAAEATLSRDYKALGPLTFWEFMVILLLCSSTLLLFCQKPIIFRGWVDFLYDYFNIYAIYDEEDFIRDSSPILLVVCVMLFLPSNLSFFKNFKAKVYEDLPKEAIPSVLNYKKTIAELPYSFVFIFGASFTASRVAKQTGLYDKIGDTLAVLLSPLPNIVALLLFIIFRVLMSNLGSNKFVDHKLHPISMSLAQEIGRNPLMYTIANGFSDSFCFMLPVGATGNLIVQAVAKIPTVKMIKAGVGPTITTIIITWLAIFFYAPIIWPDLNIDKPTWIS